MQLAVKPGQFETELQPERRSVFQTPERVLGRVIACDGSRATIASSIDSSGFQGPDSWTIGRLISINLGTTRIVCLVYEMKAIQEQWSETGPNPVHVQVELLGEVSEIPGQPPRFRSGIGVYPSVGAPAHRIRAEDLTLVHDLGTREAVVIGNLTQDETIPATVCIGDMLSRHFAILGTTGVGKSSAVSLLLRKCVASRPRLRVLILDPHNEYANAFPDRAVTIDADSVDLPFWMFKLEELADVVFRGRDALADEGGYPARGRLHRPRPLPGADHPFPLARSRRLPAQAPARSAAAMAAATRPAAARSMRRRPIASRMPLPFSTS